MFNENLQSTNGKGRKPTLGALQNNPSLKDYLPVLFRGKWIIIISTIVFFNIAMLMTIRQDPVYESSVSVLINTAGNKSTLVGGIVAVDPKSLGNELELLQSRMIAELVAERLMDIKYLDSDSLKPIPILRQFDEIEGIEVWSSVSSVTRRVRNAVIFSPHRDSDFISIIARSNNNTEAALLANMYAEIYYERNFHVSSQQSRAVREFLEEQLTSKSENLRVAEEEFRRYMERHGVVMIDNETNRLIDHIAQLEAQREATKVEIHSVSNMLLSLRRQLEEEEPNVARSISSADNPYIRMIQEQMAQLEVERDLTLTQNPDARDDERYRRMIMDIDEQLNVLRENLHRRTREYMQSIGTGTVADPAGYVKELRRRILEHDIQLQGLEFKQSAINESLQRYERQFSRLPRVSMEYAQLKRTRTSNEQLFLMLEQRYNEARIREQSDFGNVDIIDRALVPSSPVSPNMKLNLLLGLIGGSAFGLFLVIGREKIFRPIRIPEDLQKNGYVTFTTISVMSKEKSNGAVNGYIVKNGRKVDAHLITISNPLSPTSESFRLLRTKLHYSSVDNKLKTVVVTSANPGEGKSTIVANIAVCQAQAAEKVLLIDCDLRKPSLAEKLGQFKKPGLTELLADKLPFNEVVQKTVVENLDFISSGTSPGNPAELLGSKKMQTLLSVQSEFYDIILLDSPPILAASDPLVLSTITDGTIVVVASNRTKMKELDLARDSIAEVGSHINGVVLNFFNHRTAFGSAYKYKYYRYGKYGNSGKDGNKLSEVKIT
jgi:capsular exopolysaccharide synthesis family protein